jgi:hypothetical protein
MNLRRVTLLGLLALLMTAPVPVWGQGAAPSSRQTPTLTERPDLVRQYQSTITAADLSAHLYLFASDLFEGRETTTRGQKLAATYLATQYRRMGLLPKGTVQGANPAAPEAYLQPFDVYGRRLREARLELKVNGQTTATSVFSPLQQDDLAYFAFGTVAQSEAGIVFGGYGIEDPELGYDDYAALTAQNLNHTENWLMVLDDEPLANAETSLLPTSDRKPSRWSTSGSDKFQLLFGKGLPKGILIVDSSPMNTEPFAERAAQAANQGVGQLSLTEQTGGGFSFPPIYIISKAMANQLLAPTGRTIEQVQQQINQRLTPDVFLIPNTTLSSTIAHESYKASTENVVAFLEGSDPVLKNEVVVISSHYDHIGMNATASGDQISNGADDDGSGTVAVLEIAEAFAHAQADGYGPRRSILFLNVSGEEKGLLGSAYYADQQPVLPLEQTVTNLNIDMVGRRDPTYPGTQPENYVYIIGSNLISKELHEINQQANTLTGLGMDLHERFNSKDDPNRFYARSDHWNFGKHNIPFIFYFNGTHEDYHGIDDEPEKIDYPQMANRARLIFATAWQVANQDQRPAVTGTGFN